VVFLTTNHPQLIDDAAIRSGRVDFRMELSLCDRDQLTRMFLKFFDDTEAAERFAASVPAGQWSPAAVQERLLKAASVDAALELFRGAADEAAAALLRRVV
jgi:SpoVK/Ycf46/Vps4 family AAA+-type ATPase